MRIGILSDIHGNVNSLIGAYNSLRESLVDFVLNLGDSIERGYHPSEDRVVEFLKTIKGIKSIQGNHDRPNSCIFERISPDNKEFLSKLPENFDLGDLIAFHSSIREPDKYLFGVEDILEEYDYINKSLGKYRFHLFGHIHERAVYSYNPLKRSIEKLKIKTNMQLEESLSYFISPGDLCSHAIGKPSFAILDTDQNTLEYKFLSETNF